MASSPPAVMVATPGTVKLSAGLAQMNLTQMTAVAHSHKLKDEGLGLRESIMRP